MGYNKLILPFIKRTQYDADSPSLSIRKGVFQAIRYQLSYKEPQWNCCAESKRDFFYFLLHGDARSYAHVRIYEIFPASEHREMGLAGQDPNLRVHGQFWTCLKFIKKRPLMIIGLILRRSSVDGSFLIIVGIRKKVAKILVHLSDGVRRGHPHRFKIVFGGDWSSR
jgi:hypothetical protein